MLERCSVLGWAASGAMALTGHADSVPVVSPAAAFAMLGLVTGQLASVTAETGCAVRADPADLLCGRAAIAGLTRRGRVSAGGATRMLRAADGWWAVTLSRADDVAAVPAILGLLGIGTGLGRHPGEKRRGEIDSDGDGPGAAGAWAALEASALDRPTGVLVDAAQLLGVPAAALPREPGAAAAWPPWRVTRIAARSPAAKLDGAVVADLSSMWAGPLCARLLGLAGATVIKVESPDRPDGARAGDPDFFDWLHAGHRSLAADFRTGAGRAALSKLLRAADVVIEASRPRALANLGLAPEQIPHRDGQVWLSITGYGRAGNGDAWPDGPGPGEKIQDRAAFGDDAAVAGGLVGWNGAAGPPGDPVFCADAAADPLTGVCGALAVARSLAAGGGELVDLPMRRVAEAFAAAGKPDHGPHVIRPDGTVTCPRTGAEQAVLPPRRPAPAGPAARLGADTRAVLSWLASR